MISIPDLKYYISMDISRIRDFFITREFEVRVIKFRELDLDQDYSGIFIIYQTSETPGSFYKRYIEDLVCILEQKGAVMLPNLELLKAHHNKIFMEMLRSGFKDPELRSAGSYCYGSWMDARNYNSSFPVVIKQASSSASAGVFLARDKKEYDRLVRKAGKFIIGQSLTGILICYIKRFVKRIVKAIDPSKARYVEYNTSPLSTGLVVQPFIEGLKGDYKVLVYGKKYYPLYRENRKNDFRASGSGRLFDVPLEDHENLLNFARKITLEIDFPMLGVDIAFDNNTYHLLEFQVIHMGPSTLQRSRYWHEFIDGKWVKKDGISILEDEYSRSIYDFICSKYHI